MVKTIAERVLTDLDIVSLWEGRESPYFMSLLECHSEVIKRLNKLAKLLSLDLGSDFKASWWNSKSEAELVELRQEIPVRFAGNEGSSVSDEKAGAPAPTKSPVANAVQQATTPAPVVIEEAKPAPTPTEPQQESKPKASGPVRLGDLNKMAISNRSTSSLVPQAAPAAEYVSSFAGKSNAAPAAATTAAAAPASNGLVVEQPAAAAPGNGLVVEEQQVHFHDANNRPLYLKNGQPYLVPASAINPAQKYLQATEANGALKFNAEGVPVLRAAQLAPGQGAPGMVPNQPASTFYNGVAQTAQVNPANPNSFYAAANTAQNQFGASAAVGQPGVVGQPVAPQAIMLLNQMGQQVQAQFDAAGNALGHYWTSQGQQVTHYNQIAHLLASQAANSVPPVGSFTPGVATGVQPSGIGKHF